MAIKAFKAFIKKVQGQPLYIKKIILWLIVVIIGLGLGFWWIKSISQKIKEFDTKELSLPLLEEKLEELPKFEMPQLEIPEEEATPEEGPVPEEGPGEKD